MDRAVIGNAQSQGSLRDLNPVHLGEADALIDSRRIVDRPSSASRVQMRRLFETRLVNNHARGLNDVHNPNGGHSN